MKKFLLSYALVLMISSAFAQNPCTTNFKRNNGNGGGTAGNITFMFPTPVSSTLYVSQIREIGTNLTAVIAGLPNFGKNNTEVTYGFQSNNLPPAGILEVTFFFDVNNNQIKDATESSYICNTGTGNSTLPVTLAKFEAAQKSGKVTLNWNTTLELNNDGFEIERRIGNGTYQKIAFVDSKAPGGNGTAYSYSFDDNTALPKGVTYYRLKQIDFDGRAAYSEIRAVRSANGTLLLSVYPNPSRGTTNVAIPAGTGAVDVTLTDFTGKSLQQWSAVHTSNLQLTNLKPGMYTLRVSVRATGEMITERISVQ